MPPRDYVPAPVQWPGARRRRRRRHRSRGHSGSRSRRSTVEQTFAPGEEDVAAGAPVDGNGALFEDERPPREDGDGRRPGHRHPSGHGTRRRRRKRGRLKRLFSPSHRRRARFEARGVFPEQRSARSVEKQRRRKKRLLVGSLVVVGVLGLGAAVADAYLQASRVLDDVREAGEGLKAVRAALVQGKVPSEDSFTQATQKINEAEQTVSGARPTYRVVGFLPFIGLPVKASDRLLEASRHELAAGFVAKDLVEGVIGKSLAGSKTVKSAEEREERPELTPEEREELRKERRAAGGEPGGGNAGDRGESPEEDDPDALINEGVVNLEKIRSFGPASEELLTELDAAEAAVESIGNVPFVSKAEDLRRDLVSEIRQARRLVQRGLTGLKFIPPVLGGKEEKRYLMLFQDSGYLRGTGGAYFAYVEFSVKNGNLTLVESGPIIDIERYRDEDVPVPEGNWYLDTFKLSRRMNNLNWDPHFPHTAPVAADIYKVFTGRDVDGVLQIDVTGVSYLLGAVGQIQVDAWDGPIKASNFEDIALRQSYVEFADETGDAGGRTTGQARKEFNEQLVQATWEALQDPNDVIKTVFQLSRALAERHLQLWMRGPGVQSFMEELGWAGAIKDTPGDYLYVVDQNLGDDTLDAYASERVEHDVTVNEDGSLDVTATVRITNFVEKGLPYPIVPKEGKSPIKRTYVNLYAPGNAALQSVQRVHPVTGASKVDDFLENTEVGRKVFSARLAVKPQQTAALVFRYRVPEGLLDQDGKVYRLTLQRQPRVNDQSVRVVVRYPDGWAPDRPSDAWTVSEGRAVYFNEALTEDVTLELRF